MQQPPGGYGHPPGGYGPPGPGGYGPPGPGGYGPPGPGGYGPPPGGYGPPGPGGYGPPPGGFMPPRPSGPPPNQPKQGIGTAAIVLIVLAVLIALGGGGCALCVCIGAKSAQQRTADTSPPQVGGPTPQPAIPSPLRDPSEEVVRVPIATLLKDYKDNEVRADGLYGGRIVEITGRVNDVKKDFRDRINVILSTGKRFEIPMAQCYFGDEHQARAAALTKGSTITVRGRVDRRIFHVQINDCEFL